MPKRRREPEPEPELRGGAQARPEPAEPAAELPGGALASVAAQEEEQAPRCWVCLEDTGRRTRSCQTTIVSCGCACSRGSAGHAHLGCLVSMAQHNEQCWVDCPTCKQNFKGTMVVPMAEARLRLAQALPTGDEDSEMEQLIARHGLALALEEMGRFHEARALYEAVIETETVLLGPAHLSVLLTKNNLADLLEKVGERSSARRMCAYTSNPHVLIPREVLRDCLWLQTRRLSRARRRSSVLPMTTRSGPRATSRRCCRSQESGRRPARCWRRSSRATRRSWAHGG